MRAYIGFVAGALAAGTLLVAGRALSQDAGGGAAPPPAERKSAFKGADPREHDPAEMQKRMMESMMPNQFHERLGKHIGEWDVEFSMWMGGPGAPAQTSKGVAKMSWLFPGRWVKEEYKGTLMGMPFEGQSILGYDNFKKKYVGCWVDNMNTAMSTMEGNYGMDGKTMLMYGRMNEPMTGELDKTVRYVGREVSDDEFTFEIHDLGIGEANTKVIEMRYRRKAAPAK